MFNFLETTKTPASYYLAPLLPATKPVVKKTIAAAQSAAMISPKEASSFSKPLVASREFPLSQPIPSPTKFNEISPSSVKPAVSTTTKTATIAQIPIKSVSTAQKEGNSATTEKKWKSWSECSSKERWIIVGKIAIIILVIAAMATACFFTGFAALGLFAALAIGASSSSFAAVGAVFGVSAGFGLATLTMPYFAHRNHMYEYNEEENKRQTAIYLLQALGVTAVTTGVCAGLFAGTFVGVGFGLKALDNIDFSSLIGYHAPTPPPNPPHSI